MDYYGFVYIWKDSLKQKYYIGSHLGSTSDSYIGSNTWLKAAHKKRPQTFKRRVISYLTNQGQTSKETLSMLHQLEQKWLDLIPESELSISENVINGTCRYYNMKKIASGGNGSANKGKPKTKPSWNKGLTVLTDPRIAPGWNKGLTALTDPRIAIAAQKISQALEGKKKTPEHRERIGMAGRKKRDLGSYSKRSKKQAPKWLAIDPNGVIHQIPSMEEFAENFKVSPVSLYRNAYRDTTFVRKPLRGWKIKRAEGILLPGPPP